MSRRPAAGSVDGQPASTADGPQPAAEPANQAAGPANLTAGPANRAAGRHASGERIAVADQRDPSIGRPTLPAEQPTVPIDQFAVPADQLTVPAGRGDSTDSARLTAIGVASRNGAAPADLNGRPATATAPATARQFRIRQPASSPGQSARRRHAAAAPGPGLLNRAIRWVILLAVTAAAVFGLRQYVIASYYIPSASMETTLHGCPGCQPDMVLVDKLSYRFRSVSRSDVVVFARPPQAPPEDKQLIKRVIGLPGDVVSGHDGHVFVDNKELVEPYVDPACHGTADFAPVRVPTGRYFVMGDNRCDSFDSRMFGTIPRSAVIGRAFAVIWPVHHLRWL